MRGIWYPAQSGLCRWSWHPLPSVFTQRLCIHIHSIAFLACCSNLAEESFIQSASHARAMGNCSTCCIGRGKEVGMADDGRCVVHSLCWNELTTTCDRGLRYKPSCFQQHQMIFQKCLKLVGRKWFPFRRFLMAGRSAVFSQMNAECTPTFSLFLYWQDPFTLPCVTACEANTTYYNIIFCQCFRSSSHSFRHVMLATIQALSSLSWFAPWWSARFSNLTVQIIERCPKRAPRMPAQAGYRPRRASLEPKVCSRTGIFKCVMYAMQNGFKMI